jgi:hypothetical protein
MCVYIYIYIYICILDKTDRVMQTHVETAATEAEEVPTPDRFYY